MIENPVFLGAVMSTINLMMCRGVRNWPFTPAAAILLSRNKVVDMLDGIPMADRDTNGDLYE